MVFLLVNSTKPSRHLPRVWKSELWVSGSRCKLWLGRSPKRARTRHLSRGSELASALKGVARQLPASPEHHPPGGGGAAGQSPPVPRPAVPPGKRLSVSGARSPEGPASLRPLVLQEPRRKKGRRRRAAAFLLAPSRKSARNALPSRPSARALLDCFCQARFRAPLSAASWVQGFKLFRYSGPHLTSFSLSPLLVFSYKK